jgi:hypothetical protein
LLSLHEQQSPDEFRNLMSFDPNGALAKIKHGAEDVEKHTTHMLGKDGHGILHKLPHDVPKLPTKMPNAKDVLHALPANKVMPRRPPQPPKTLPHELPHNFPHQLPHSLPEAMAKVSNSSFIPREWLRDHMPKNVDPHRPVDAHDYINGRRKIPQPPLPPGTPNTEALKENIADKLGWFKKNILGKAEDAPAPNTVVDKVKDYQPERDWGDAKEAFQRIIGPDDEKAKHEIQRIFENGKRVAHDYARTDKSNPAWLKEKLKEREEWKHEHDPHHDWNAKAGLDTCEVNEKAVRIMHVVHDNMNDLIPKA